MNMRYFNSVCYAIKYLIVISIFFLNCSLTLAAENIEAAKINAFSGNDFTYNGNKIDNSRFVRNAKIFVGDIIETGLQSTIEVEMVNGVKLEILAMAKVQFGLFNIRIFKGGVWTEYKSNKTKKRNFEVITPYATIGIKGTVFKTEYDELNKITFVEIIEGIIEFKTVEGKLIEAGCGKMIKYNEATKNIELFDIFDPMAIDANNDDFKNFYRRNEKTKIIDNKIKNLSPLFEQEINNKKTPFDIE